MSLLRCLLLSLLIAAVPLCAATPADATALPAGVVEVPASADRLALNGQLSWWVPPAAGTPLDAVRLAAFSPAPAGPGYGVRNAPVWFRIDLQNGSAQSRDFLLEVAFTKLDFLDVHVVHGDGRVDTWATGELRPYDTRPLGSPRFVFPLSFAGNEQATVFLRVESAAVVNLPLTLYDEKTYLGVSSRLHGWLGLFYGLVLGVLAYNAYLFRTTRELAFLNYVLGGTLAMGYFLSIDGYLAAMLPARPAAAQSLLFLCGTLSVTFTLLFARGFLELARLAPQLDRVMKFTAVAAAVFAVATLWLPALVAMGLTIVFSVAMAVLMTIAGVLSLRSGFRPARWFVLAISIHLIALLLITLGILAIVPGLFALADTLHRVGFVLNLMCFTLAIGDRIRHMDEERRLADERALAAASDIRARNEFLSRMSHELRTPMTGVLGMAELLEHTELAPTQRRYLATLRYSGEMLLNLINDVLDHARMQTGRLQVRREAFDLLRLVDECRTLFDQQPRDGSVLLGTDIGGNLSRVAVGDGQRLRQVLINLLAQALRQSSRGTVMLRVRALDAPGWLRFEIEAADAGTSGSRDDARRLLDETGAARHGLGLSVCRQLVEAMGGQIGVAGDARTLFWFELPLNTAP